MSLDWTRSLETNQATGSTSGGFGGLMGNPGPGSVVISPEVRFIQQLHQADTEQDLGSGGGLVKQGKQKHMKNGDYHAVTVCWGPLVSVGSPE